MGHRSFRGRLAGGFPWAPARGLSCVIKRSKIQTTELQQCADVASAAAFPESKAVSFSATMFWHCKCGAEVHVVMECEVVDHKQDPLPVKCWSCERVLGQVPAVQVVTAATAQAALKASLASAMAVH